MRRTLLVVAVLAVPAVARAGACPGPHLVVMPRDGGVAPTNPLVRALFPADQVEVIEVADPVSRQITGTAFVTAADAELRLRDDADGLVVPTVTRRSTGARNAVIDLLPSAPLAPAHHYSVVVHTRAADLVASRFTTGDGPDVTPPALDRVTSAQVYRWGEATDWKDPSGAYVELAVTPPGESVFYELHEVGADGVADETTLRALSGSPPQFGSLSSCARPTYELHDVGVRGKTLAVAVRAIDAAGNHSPLRAVTVDLARVRTRR